MPTILSVRTLLRSPGYTAGCVIVLTLGIGAIRETIRRNPRCGCRCRGCGTGLPTMSRFICMSSACLRQECR